MRWLFLASILIAIGEIPLFLADYHTHSDASPDGHVTVSELASAAIKAGLTELCITDHAECHGFIERFDLPDDVLYFYKEKLDEEFPKAQAAYGDQIKLLYGVELAQGHESPDVYHDILAHTQFDFVINSLHNLRGENDFCYVAHYPSTEVCRDLLRRYVEELYETARLDQYDVIAHIGYPLRYMRYRDGFDVSLDAYQAEFAEIFKYLVQNGRGIELNVSGLRDGGRNTFPTLDVLKLYRSCGGEIITVGSDSHYARYIGVGIARGYEMLREAGFRYVTAYDHRVPRFEAL